MYKCEDCGLIFDQPKYIKKESYYGVGDLFTNSSGTIGVCPNCEGDYDDYEDQEEEDDETE